MVRLFKSQIKSIIEEKLLFYTIISHCIRNISFISIIRVTLMGLKVEMAGKLSARRYLRQSLFTHLLSFTRRSSKLRWIFLSGWPQTVRVHSFVIGTKIRRNIWQDLSTERKKQISVYQHRGRRDLSEARQISKMFRFQNPNTRLFLHYSTLSEGGIKGKKCLDVQVFRNQCFLLSQPEALHTTPGFVSFTGGWAELCVRSSLLLAM